MTFSSSLDSFWLLVTSLGRDEVFIIGLALFTWLARPAGGRQLGVVFALSYLTNTALKYGLDLPRPFTGDPAVASAAAQATAGGPGLPSGHAQMSATLWLGLAAQLRRPGVWLAAGLLVALVAVSRLALGVHYPADVLVGLLLGLGFALLGSRLALPSLPWLGLIPLLVAAVLPSGVPSEAATGLGLLSGFLASRCHFRPPQGAAGAVIVAVLGLVIVFAVYLALSALLPDAVKNLPLGRAARYALLVLVATEGVPRVLARWLPRGAAVGAGR